MYDTFQLRTFDPLLTNYSDGYGDQDLFGEVFFPITRIGSMSARYRIFGRENWLIFPARREPGAVANEVEGGRWSETSFSIKQYALQSYVTDEEREDAASGLNNGELNFLNPELDATALITRSLMLQHEKKVADTLLDTANYPGANTVTLAGTARWDDYTTLAVGATEWWQTVSDPVKDMNAAIAQILAGTHRLPNTLMFSLKAWNAAKNHPRVVSKFANFQLTNPTAFLELLDMTGMNGQQGPAAKIVIPNSSYNAADNIDATENIVGLWGTDVWVGLVDATPGQRTKTFGKTFSRPYNGNLRPIDKWREESRKSDLIRCHWRWDLVITSNVAGYLIKTATS